MTCMLDAVLSRAAGNASRGSHGRRSADGFQRTIAGDARQSKSPVRLLRSTPEDLVPTGTSDAATKARWEAKDSTLPGSRTSPVHRRDL